MGKKKKNGRQRKASLDAFDIAPLNSKFLWFACVSYFISWFALLWIGRMPWYLLLVKGVLALPALIAMWKYTSNQAKGTCVLPTIAMLVVYATFWLTGKTGLWMQMLLLPTLVGVCVWLYRKAEMSMGLIVCGMEATQVFFLLMAQVEKYTFSTNGIAFWQIVLTIALPVGVILTVLLLRKTGFRVGRMLGFFALFAFLVAIVVWIYLAHLNYVLDTNPTETHTLIIRDKDIDNNRKSADDYEFKFELGGRVFWHEVTFEEYYQYEIGDTYHLVSHKGAFYEPFLLTSEENAPPNP